jgi:hypothetical protein
MDRRSFEVFLQPSRGDAIMVVMSELASRIQDDLDKRMSAVEATVRQHQALELRAMRIANKPRKVR